ncbi:hypothetical protein DEU34_1340 [Microbacterium sp. AG1240]|nr:hypothetical protein DEU34_1340 [Microbacterium sp. AG1240]
MARTARGDVVSLALHRELDERLRLEPVFVVVRALQNVPRKRDLANGGARDAIDRWESLLRNYDFDGLRRVFLGEDDDSRMMRGNTVFQGVLTNEEREQILAGIPDSS